MWNERLMIRLIIWQDMIFFSYTYFYMPLEYYCFSHALRYILLDSFNDNSCYACADADLYLKIDPPCRSLSKGRSTTDSVWLKSILRIDEATRLIDSLSLLFPS